MNAISSEELDALPLEALVSRMDEFLRTSNVERNGQHAGLIPFSVPSELMRTAVVQRQPESIQRKIAYLCFAYLVQLQLESVSSGIANRVLFGEQFAPSHWASPAFRLREAALRQFQTISSRIAFEIFIDLLCVVETGERLKSKRSKLTAFASWLRNTENRFHYFAHVLVAAYHFDRELRTPEVHGASRLPRRMLMLQVPSHDESNEQFRLTNALLGVWQPLVDLLNEQRPNYMQIDRTDREWFEVYVAGDDVAIESKLAEMFDAIRT